MPASVWGPWSQAKSCGCKKSLKKKTMPCPLDEELKEGYLLGLKVREVDEWFNSDQLIQCTALTVALLQNA
jgi:hypothetical protein